MARSRKGRTETVNKTERKGTMAVEALNAEAIAALLSSSRQRGQYDTELKSFIESNEPGVKVNLESGTFAGKKAQSVKTGFEGARKREGAPEAAQHVRVIVNEEQVYLIRTDMQ